MMDEPVHWYPIPPFVKDRRPHDWQIPFGMHAIHINPTRIIKEHSVTWHWDGMLAFEDTFAIPAGPKA